MVVYPAVTFFVIFQKCTCDPRAIAFIFQQICRELELCFGPPQCWKRTHALNTMADKYKWCCVTSNPVGSSSSIRITKNTLDRLNSNSLNIKQQKCHNLPMHCWLLRDSPNVPREHLLCTPLYCSCSWILKKWSRVIKFLRQQNWCTRAVAYYAWFLIGWKIFFVADVGHSCPHSG